MEKAQLDDFTFINIFNKKDFENEETLQGIINSCEKIMKSYKDVFDPSSNINEFKDSITNFFLSDSDLLTFILYTKKDCEPGKRKPISFAHFSANNLEKKEWSIDLIHNRLNSDMDFQKKLMQSAFKYLKDKKAERIATNVKITNKDSQKFFNELIKESFPSEENNVCDSTNFVTYTFNLDSFKLNLPKYEEKTA